MHLRLVGLWRQSIFSRPLFVLDGHTKAVLMAFSGRSLDTAPHVEHISPTDDLVDMREFGSFFLSLPSSSVVVKQALVQRTS